MKVAILLNDLTANGGAPRQAMLLARGLQSLGHRVTLYAARYCPQICYPRIAESLDIRAARTLSVKEARAHAAGHHHSLAFGARRHFWDSGRLAELVREPYDILNPHVRGATRAAVWCKRRSGTPVVWMCDDARNWEEPGYRAYYSPPVQWVFDRVMARLEKPVVREIDRIVALDTRVAKILAGYYGRPAEVVRSGLDAVSFRERPEARAKIRLRHGIPPSAFLLLWLGIIEPHRHLEDALDALRLLRMRGHADIRLLIAGSAASSPRYAQALSRLTERYHLSDSVGLHFAAVPESEMADYYSSADALVYLADNQCWGLGVFEAIACNLPVIVSRACGAHEVLDDRETAMLVSPRDSEDLARAIAALVESPALQERLARQARARIVSRMTWDAYARDMLRVFEEVRGARRGCPAPARQEALA